MDRRGFIGSVGAAVTLVSAGCTEGIEGVIGAIPDAGANEFGDPIKHRGVQIVPTHWMTADQVTYHVDKGGSPSSSAPRGAVFILTRLEARTVGENRRVLPSRATASGWGSGHIRVFYNDERSSSTMHDEISNRVEIEGQRLPLYEQVRQDEDAVGAVYPGVEVAGWVVNEIPESFDIAKTTLKVEWGAGSQTSQENLAEHEWVYTEGSEVTPDEAAEVDGSNSTTVTL